MLTSPRCARAAALLMLFALSACSSVNSGSDFFANIYNSVTDFGNKVSDSVQSPLARTGLYLHEDQYQQKADSAVADFNKIDLSSKFDEEFKQVTSYDTEEDQAVAALQTSARNQELQQFIQMPAWQRACADLDNHKIPCSGEPRLRYDVYRTLGTLIGKPSLSPDQHLALRKAFYFLPARLRNQETTRRQLASAVSNYKKLTGKVPDNPCSPGAPEVAAPAVCGDDADCVWTRVQHYCWELANTNNSVTQDIPWLRKGEILDLIQKRDDAVQKRANDKAEADDLAAKIAKLSKPDLSIGEFDSIVSEVKKALGPGSSALSQYLDNSAIAGQLQFLLSDQLGQNVPKLQGSAATPANRSAAQNAPTSQPLSAKPSKQPTSDTGRIQALIDLAMSGANFASAYTDQGSYDRVNSLLLATAYARHKANMAKLDADYQDDLITIYNAEIDVRFRQAIHLNEVNLALDSAQFVDDGFASPPPQSQIKLDALAAWTASQDEGEIPYQVLQAKEVQLLRAQSLKQGRLAAQDYEGIIKPVLAQLDAYAKGGVTTQAIVQALGFIGVITSISAK